MTNLNVLLVLIAVVAAITITELVAPRAHAANHSPVLSYEITDLPAGTAFQVTYSGGVTSNTDGKALASHGGFAQVAFVSNFGLDAQAATKAGVLNGSVSEVVGVSGPKITGIASVPAGATVTLLNTQTNQTIDIPNGPFTIDTGQELAAKQMNTTDETVSCQGTAASCGAAVDITGPPTRRQVSIDLSQSGLGLESVRPTPASEKTGFNLTGGHLTENHQHYVVDIDTLQAEPTGVQLHLDFDARGRG
jgi:hypothetical protein